MDDKNAQLRGKLEDLFSDLSQSIQAEAGPTVPSKSTPERAPEAERLLTKPLAALRTLAENTTDAIFLSDLAGCVTFSNRACCDLLGYDYVRQEMVGLETTALWPDEEKARLTDDILPQALTREWHGPVMQRRKDGSLLRASLILFPIADEQEQPIAVAFIVHDLTEHKQAEEALAQERSLLRMLIDNLPDLIYVKDSQSRFVVVNQAQARLLGGTTPDEVLGKSDFDFFPHELAQKYYADEQAILQSGQPLISVEEPTTDTAGHKKWLTTTKVPLRDSNGQVMGLVGVGRDITEHKQAEESLRESEEKYRTILENMHEGYFEVDIAGNLTFFNDALCRIHGYPRDELMGMNNREYMDAENAKRVYRAFNEVYRTRRPAPAIGYEILRKDGTRKSVEITASLITDPTGEPIGFRGILRDVTERKRAEAERERLLAALERRAVQLQTAAEVSRAASSILTVDELLPQMAELIRDRFNLYYVGIFLVDEANKYAVLRAGTGEAGRKLIEDGHKLEQGGASMIGRCIANRQARIALDVGQEAVRFANPLLPKTRSEMALPLISRDLVIGAMTIQSDQPAAFAQEDISVLQSMADQTANAIQNARLFEESQRRAAREQMLNTVAARMRAGLTLDQVLNTTVQQVGTALGAARVAVRLKPTRGDGSQTMAREQEG
jgi:PAS domain S-box-containing protein